MKAFQTNVLCPACKMVGQPNRLNQTIGEEELFCEDPRTGNALHTFKSYAYVEAYEPDLSVLDEPAPVPEPPKEHKKAAAKKADPEDEGARAKQMASKMMDPPPALPELIQPELAKAETQAEAVVDGDKYDVFPVNKTKSNAPTIPHVATTKYMPFKNPPAKLLPGGAVILKVEIPDPYPSMLNSYAEMHHETLEQYMQRMIVHGLQSEWFYS